MSHDHSLVGRLASSDIVVFIISTNKSVNSMQKDHFFNKGQLYIQLIVLPHAEAA